MVKHSQKPLINVWYNGLPNNKNAAIIMAVKKSGTDTVEGWG